MNGYIAVAEGAPCPTLVLNLEALPTAEAELTSALLLARGWLRGQGLGHVLKIALIRPSAHPMFDLDYRFVQIIPGAEADSFEYLGSCGHSILASVMVANRLGWVNPLAPGSRVRVNVLNNNDNVVCEADEVDRIGGNLTAHFLNEPAAPLADLLLTGEPCNVVVTARGTYEVSLVSMGNPYVFVRAGDLGVSTQEELFADDAELFDTLVEIRREAGATWGFPASSAFPKIAAVASFAEGGLSVRAISVPTWHPTLALTGATCVAAAAAVPGTVVHELAERAGCSGGTVRITTPGNVTEAQAVVQQTEAGPHLAWVSVSGKRARNAGPVLIEPLRDLQGQEGQSWLRLPV